MVVRVHRKKGGWKQVGEGMKEGEEAGMVSTKHVSCSGLYNINRVTIMCTG